MENKGIIKKIDVQLKKLKQVKVYFNRSHYLISKLFYVICVRDCHPVGVNTFALQRLLNYIYKRLI